MGPKKKAKNNQKPEARLDCRQDGSGVRLKVHLTPKASKEGVGGLYGDALKVRVKAPPVEGKANEAMVKLMARTLGVSRKSIELVSGQRSRIKIIRVKGLSPGRAAARLAREHDENSSG